MYGLNNTRKVTCCFVENDVMSGNYEVMMECSIKFFSFADFGKIFTNIIEVMYLDIKSKIVIVSTPFCKLSIYIVKV